MKMTKIHVDAELCRDCQACELACSLVREGQSNPALARLQVTKDMARYEFDILICQQCQPALCMEACPNEAILRDERGVVLILDEQCLRCGECAEACPYHAIFYHQATDRYLKCDLCAGVEGGPACVAICPVGALTLMLETVPEEQ